MQQYNKIRRYRQGVNWISSKLFMRVPETEKGVSYRIAGESQEWIGKAG